MDIISQVRFVNEQRSVGRKAKGAKDVKRLLSEKGRPLPAAGAPHSRLRWVGEGGVRAVVSVVWDGNDIEGISVTDTTTALTILEVRNGHNVDCLLTGLIVYIET